jgi:hypothetical protein
MPVLLPALTDKEYKPTLLAEIKVGDRPAVGVLLSHKDHKDVSLYFDKENGLLLKSEIRLVEPRQNKEMTLEYLYSDYKELDGIKLPSKIAFKIDNKDFMMELTEIKPVDKVENSQFDKP